MPKCLIAYYSQHGTTAQVAERIAEGLRAVQYQVDLHSIAHDKPTPIDDYSLIGIGSPVYFCTMPLNVRAYLNRLPQLNGVPAFVFVLHGSFRALPSMANPWVIRQLFSRSFRVDAGRCSHCGLCARLCPMGNITVGKDGLPVWGRDCLFCTTCELKCPEEAVKSPLDWPTMERLKEVDRHDSQAAR